MTWPMLALLSVTVGAAPIADPDLDFQGPLSRVSLERYLARSITMEGVLHGSGDLADDLRMLTSTGAKFIGRAACLWAGESGWVSNIERIRQAAAAAHAADPQLLLQACIFEIVTQAVDGVPVPAWAFELVGQPTEQRNFRYADMLANDGQRVDFWAPGASVPDITRPETQLYFTFLGASYIDAGLEALHLGQVELIGRLDAGAQWASYQALVDRLHEYARSHARRGWVLLDGHVPSGGLVRDGRLLLDFHSFPLRIREVEGQPERGVLEVGHVDSLYGRSKGGQTAAGWSCESLPYLAEIDNWGPSETPGQGGLGGAWVWGYDEISWFARQSETDRAAWLRYAWHWIRATDPNGWLQMPGSRTLAAPVGERRWYHANAPSAACPTGWGDEAVVARIWAGWD